MSAATSADTAPGAAGKTRKPKPAAKITIAADPMELDRLRGLVALMPAVNVRIVPATGDAARADTDFSIATADDQSGAGVKTDLFAKQLHILATNDIQSVEGLRNKVVSFGPDRSASQAMARRAFEALKIPVNETPLDLDNALDGLSTGDVSAVVVIAPEPVRQFEKLSTPGLHLLQWPAGGALPAGTSMTTIASSAYPGLANRGEVLRALGVDTYLKTNAASRAQDRLFLAALAQHAAVLSKRGFDRLGADLDGNRKRRVAEGDPR